MIYTRALVNSIFANYPFMCAMAAMFMAQGLKLFYYLYKEKRINFRYLVQAGGMPSSHSAMVAALAMAIGLQEGFGTSVFAVAICFAMIVLYDAAGVRRAAGKQAKVLNVIISDFVDNKKLRGEKLKELIGHTPMEVVAGVGLGILIAFLMY